jgi:hypothetical protein
MTAMQAKPLQVPMPDGRHWFCLATAAIVDFEEADWPGWSFIVMQGHAEPLLVPASVPWLLSRYAQAMTCPVPAPVVDLVPAPPRRRARSERAA